MRKLAAVAGATALAAGLFVGALPSQAADHLDAPAVMQDGRTDITDLFAFQSPSNANNTVMAMAVNPGAGAISGTTFDTNAWYQIHVDTGGPSVISEKAWFVSFGPVGESGSQPVTIYGPDDQGNRRFLGQGRTGHTIDLPGGGKFTAGLYDDPFFFDLAAFNNGLAFCPNGEGTDFFAGLNVSAIVLEMPNTSIGQDNVGIYATTVAKDGYRQIDRMGRPAISTVFIAPERKDAFNQSKSSSGAAFRSDTVGLLSALGNDDATANAIADVLLPDTLTVDISNPAGFLNGRGLADDVIDAELGLISGGAVPTDCVDANDKEFSDSFPYLAAPHEG